ncbi:MAG: hypothetical protein A3B96_01505 [Candidatus Spechtbacteria bacterium RIFCSPHIGHO2_02_FULL_43_15b]|uniref:Theronine dehydrogenase n=1 Tax=Candidatus Spechtbacteria bacterium RIFCSPHIGHO2_01_FULL_43_30 TaxID=1802158 RepID=A0A1G2H7Q4_9BACT|nr:MAG: hypothetical protein A2827_01610 [Candidatus Spechtbacteria bacterium RIFCSPHIGHO2_01_FULL_43_30]OGZ60439.1 MAG: hypothetical protein A3B96_01505 [Candidatus Spechtbacteria bacterium RIFCSPHIGHO2_02_FULL_43_15b]
MRINKQIKTGNISALTFDSKADGWDSSSGFFMRKVPMPRIDEENDPKDAVSVIIKVMYAGICGTDRGIWARQVFRELMHDSLNKEGGTLRILGHEFVGEVVKAGSHVENLYGIKVSQKVSGDSHITCGRCFQCKIGEEEVCKDQTILGVSTNGIFAKYAKIPAKNLWEVDFSRIRPEVAAILDPFGNAVHACSKVDLRGKRVGILGCGPIGMFTILLCRTFGASKIIAVDRNSENLDIARELGADRAILISRKDASTYLPDKKLENAVRKLTYGKGVDVAFEMAGGNESVSNALSIARNGGDVILFGLKDGDFTIPKFSQIIVKRLNLHGVIGRQIFQTWQTSQRILHDKKNGVQDKIWSVILKRGRGTVMDFDKYTPELFKDKMKYPKILLKM